MTRTYRRPTAGDLEAMATFAAARQSDPDHHIPYLGLKADSIATDVGELEGWTETATVAEDNGELIGWLVAEVDRDMGRTWWWGPFAATEAWDETADGLYVETRSLLGSDMTEEEACADDRSTPIPQWCLRHGLVSDPASVLLRREPDSTGGQPSPGPGVVVRPMAEPDHRSVKALHGPAFAGTHTTPDALVESTHPRAVVEADGVVVGYVAYEHQSDGSGYIDFLAVDEARRGRGLGGVLVQHACDELFTAGVAYVSLTVREDNAAARALYRRLGFIEERIARPYRLGFTVP